MLWTIAIVLFVIWGVGLLSSYTMGGVLHVLLVAALVVAAVRLLRGRRVLS